MIAYLIKSGFCLVVLLAIYLVLLEREKMHRFNRIFLLAALVVGLTAPMFSIDIVRNKMITETPTKIVNDIAATSSDLVAKAAEYPSNRSKITEPSYSELSVLNSSEIGYKRNFSYHFLKGLLLIFYSLVCFFLFLRMSAVLYRFYRKRKRNREMTFRSTRLVLVNEVIAPHTFLRTVFVNKEQYQSGNISDQILDHELTHVQQMHSLDVLFVEVLRIIFWFNPVFYFYKKAIQINHEFLADESVLNKTNDPISYKNLLLESVLPSYKTDLSSSFNYNLTKKRFLMMLKESSSLSILSRKIVLIPTMVSLALIFGTEISQERRLYEIDGVKYYEAFQVGSLDSDLILLNKIEDTKETLYFFKWTYYNEEGIPYTGNWISDKKYDDDKAIMKSEIEDGKLLSRTIYDEKPNQYPIFRSRYKGDKIVNTTFSESNSISSINAFNYLPDDVSTLRIVTSNKEGTWTELKKLERLTQGEMEKVYLSTTFNSSWNIIEQKVFDRKGEQTLTLKHKEILVQEAELNYQETLEEFNRLVSKVKWDEVKLVYAELELAYSMLSAYQKELDGNNNPVPVLPQKPMEIGGQP